MQLELDATEIPPHLKSYFEPVPGPKQKDALGIPWLVAFALRADGWWLRSAITWCKGNPMPESVTDRPTSATEQVFLLAKSANYFYDAEAVRESNAPGTIARLASGAVQAIPKHGKWQEVNGTRQNVDFDYKVANGRNRRNWWLINSEPYPGSHYATMPSKLVEPCILAGTSAHGCCAVCGAPWARVVERVAALENGRKVPGLGVTHDRVVRNRIPGGDGSSSTLHHDVTTVTTGWQPACTCNADIQPCVVLDPFFGSGTTAAVALKHGRNFVGIDLDARNLELAHARIERSQPTLFTLEPSP